MGVLLVMPACETRGPRAEAVILSALYSCPGMSLRSERRGPTQGATLPTLLSDRITGDVFTV